VNLFPYIIAVKSNVEFSVDNISSLTGLLDFPVNSIDKKIPLGCKPINTVFSNAT
jgi:hypothetical protein